MFNPNLYREMSNLPYPGNEDIIEFVTDHFTEEELGREEGVTRTPIQYICNSTGQSALMNALDVPKNKSIVCVLYYEDVIQKAPSLKQSFENRRLLKQEAMFKEIADELAPKIEEEKSQPKQKATVEEIKPGTTVEVIELPSPASTAGTTIKITKTTRRKLNLDPESSERSRETQDDTATLKHLSNFQRQMKERAEIAKGIFM